MYNLKSLYIHKAKGKNNKRHSTWGNYRIEGRRARGELVGATDWASSADAARPGSEVVASGLVPSGPSSAVADSSLLQFLPPPSQTSPLPPQK